MEKQLGPEAKLKATVVEGKIRLEIVYDGKQLDGGAWIATGSDELIDALCDLVPGESAIESGLAGLMKAALKKVTV